MLTTTLAASVALAVGLGLFLFAEFRGLRSLKWIAKPLASLSFLAVALSVDALATPVGQAIFVALVLSFLGDVLLIPDNQRSFLGGIGSFLLAHVGFIAAFLLRGVSVPATGAAVVALVPVAFLIGRWLLPHVHGPMKGAVLAYMTVITLMVAASVGTLARDGWGAPAWPWPVAAVMFFVSDLSVARDRFVAPGFDNRLWGLPLYYGAQLWFALLAAPSASGL